MFQLKEFDKKYSIHAQVANQPLEIWKVILEVEVLWSKKELEGQRSTDLTQYRFKNWLKLPEQKRHELMEKLRDKKLSVPKFMEATKPQR